MDETITVEIRREIADRNSPEVTTVRLGNAFPFMQEATAAWMEARGFEIGSKESNHLVEKVAKILQTSPVKIGR
jgi:hypothetical protein